MTQFRIPIGDWSDDGHGKCDWFTATADKSLEEIREAYFAAKEKYPDLCPEKFCHYYQDNSVPEEVVNKAAELGFQFELEAIEEDGKTSYSLWDTREMASYVVWFLNQGDPNLNAKIDDTQNELTFYGHDEKGRHIGHIGYGIIG